MYGSKKKRQNKNIGGDVMSAIRKQAKKEGFMTGQDDERDIREFLQTKATKAMFDREEKKEKKPRKKRIIKGDKGDGVDMKKVRKAADSLRMKHGGKAHKKMKHGGKPHKDMKHGGKATFPDLDGSGSVTRKDILMGRGVKLKGGGKMYASMNQRYANGGKIYPRKGNI